MNNIQQIVRLLMPVIKGFPLIFAIMALLIFIASKMVFYATPLYETTGRMKLEDVNMGISNTNLFKNFDVFAVPNKIMAEVEVIKSPELLKKAIARVKFDISYYRVGKIRTSELFYDTPFLIKYEIDDKRFFDKKFFLTIIDKEKFSLSCNLNDKSIVLIKKFGDLIQFDGLNLFISLNDSILKVKPHIKINDEFLFTINSEEAILDEVLKNIDVKEMDKDIPIVRIIYKNAVPEKAMLFTNILMESYILDGINLKTNAAKRTVNFIDDQMIDIAKKLEMSERELEAYRLSHKITNTRMEVETGLKKVAEMKIQLANIEMNLASLEAIDNDVNTKDPESFLEKAPNFEGYGGLLYTELIKRLKVLQSDRKVLLQKYTLDNEKVKNVDSDIQDVVNYIRKNISNARNSMDLQRIKINQAILDTEKEFIDVPTKEKELVILERAFQLNQNIYNFLMEKRTESAIAEAATMSFHRIIQRANIPTKPVSPKKSFTILVFGFLGLLLGISLVYIYDAVSARIKYKDELEKLSTSPVISDIRHVLIGENKSKDFLSLASKLHLKSKKAQSFLITSSVDGEGKTFIAINLAKAFSLLGIKTLLVSSDLRNKTITDQFNLNGKLGFSNYVEGENLKNCNFDSPILNLNIMPSGISDLIPEAIFAFEGFSNRIKELNNNFSVIVFDSPSLDTSIDSVSLMENSDTALYIFRANYSKIKLAIEPDLLKAEFGFENIRLILNDVPDFTKMKKGIGLRNSFLLLITKFTSTINGLFKK